MTRYMNYRTYTEQDVPNTQMPRILQTSSQAYFPPKSDSF